MLYKCDPKKNTECAKSACGVECFMTTNEKFAADDSCIILYEGEIRSTTDFAVVTANEKGEVELFYNADVLTLGIGIKLMVKEFKKHIADNSKELSDEVYKILTDEYLKGPNADE